MRCSLKEGVIVSAASGLAMAVAHLLDLPRFASMLLVALATALPLVLLASLARARQALRTKAFIQRLIDGIPDAFYIKDAEGHYLMVNKAYADERGSTPEATIGKTSSEVASTPELAREWREEDLAALAGKTVYVEQCVRHVVTGEEVFRILSKRRVENEEGVWVVVGAHFNITQWKLAERELQAALVREQNHRERVQDYVQRLFDTIPMPVYVKDARSNYLLVNSALERERGLSRAQLVGTSSIALAPDKIEAATVAREDLAVLTGETVYKEEHRRHALTGAEQFRVVSKGRCLDPDGQYVIICTLFDITQWRLAERDLQTALQEQTALRERTQSFIQRVIDVIRDPFYIKDAEGCYVMVNDALARERGQDKRALIGKLSYRHNDNPAMAAESQQEDISVIAGVDVNKELHIIMPGSGEERVMEIAKRRCTDVDGAPVIVVAYFDITRWRLAERELARMAHEDPLTGLANRRCFMTETERAFSRADRYGEALSLLLFDLDFFKRINDEHGHQVGDEVLSEVARRTRASLRGEDTPCRWGGEEFVVLLPQMSAQEASIAAERLRVTIGSVPFATSVGELNVTASCGIAQRVTGEAVTALISRADVALYQAKDAGRNVCVIAGLPQP